MFYKQTVSLLAVLSALIALPSGIARAGDIYVQNDNVQVSVGNDSGIRINTTPTHTYLFTHWLSAPIASPRSIITAGNTIVETDDVMVDVDEDDDDEIRVNTIPQRTTIIRTPQRIYRPNNVRNYGIWKNPRSTSSMQCNGRNITRTNTQSHSSGRAVNRSYSSMTTMTCQ
ncbi:hypothetical protein OGM63_09450 [Plectonema radiosum NIES-515]|uniref:Filamentous hemagglutinin outer membrane protein n=1 Tax=Plectonema radiosum NIES-515 TaxID=2986073 RepID=A0ABT3AX76_9CYAN|nr:hypothetical protein [Plectonema radiosum]MCV3213733.1 hypothetical protein [Plectonema radiosum NIES-515]